MDGLISRRVRHSERSVSERVNKDRARATLCTLNGSCVSGRVEELGQDLGVGRVYLG